MAVKMEKIGDRPRPMYDISTHYCPGCSHGILHRLIAEVITELDIQEKTIGVGGVGCSAPIYSYMEIDFVSAAHGRAPAVAAGIVRALPDKVVFTYQGDGDIIAIGSGEIIHAASRGERIVVIYENNAAFGMTGGQLAPTTLLGQRSTTTPQGRDATTYGHPIRVSELIAQFPGATYVARVAANTPGNIKKAKLALTRAFENQMFNRGLSLVECLGACPTDWGLSPTESLVWLKTRMIPYFPLGELKTPEGGGSLRA